MNRWFIQKTGTVLLSTVAGMGVFSSGAVFGQAPKLQPSQPVISARLATGIQTPVTGASPPITTSNLNPPPPQIVPRTANPAVNPVVMPPAPQSVSEQTTLQTHSTVDAVQEADSNFELPLFVPSISRDNSVKKPILLTPAMTNTDTEPILESQEIPQPNRMVKKESAPSDVGVPEALLEIARLEVEPQPGLEGCCPVSLLEDRKLIKGESELASTWEGVTYQFSSPQAKTQFDAHPAKYAPVQAGHDVTAITDAERRVAGSLKHAAWYQQKLYLFQDQTALRTFSANPVKYAQKN